MDGERSAASPLVVFTSRPNSHPFQERHIYCQDPVKIGRSVARAHPAPTNAIFDCKVLSRNHALLWFEDNKFYLQDTKSSNGTFVNNQRLSKGSEESDPHEIFSGDIIQFGVDVMENSKRVTSSYGSHICTADGRGEYAEANSEYVTHGCIMASITLYLPDGNETKPRFSSGVPSGSPHPMSAVHSQEMYQLSQYLQEALHREQVLQDKMSHLQSLLHTTNESCESSWHALINEDRLLSKLEVLQNQLSVFSKTQTEGSLQQQIVTMEEERLDYENSSKESLRKVLDEKITAIQDLSDVERSLANNENECKHLKEVQEESQQQFTELTEKYEKKMLEHSELTSRLQEVEQKRDDDLIQYDETRTLLTAQLEEALADRDTLQAKVTHLQNEQSLHISKREEPRSNGDGDEVKMNGELTDEAEHDIDLPTLTHGDEMESLTSELKSSHARIEDLQNQLNEADVTMRLRDEEIQSLNQSVEQAHVDIVAYVTKVATLEDRLKSFTEATVVHVEQTTDQLQEQITRISASREEVVQTLRDELQTPMSVPAASSLDSGDMASQVQELQEKLETAQRNTEELNAHIENIQEELHNERLVHKQRELDACKLQDELDLTKKEVESQTLSTTEFKEKAQQLEEKLQGIVVLHEEQARKSESDCSQLSQEAADNKKECEALREECISLRSRIQLIEEDLQRLQQDNTKLDNDVTSTKCHNEQLASEISQLQKSYKELKELKESLETSESTMKTNLTDVQKESEILRAQLEDEKKEREELLSKYKQSLEELELTRDTVKATQQQHSHAQQQLDTVNKKLAVVREEYKQLLEKSRSGALLSNIPLLLLVVAVALAIYPLLSWVSSS